MSKAGLTPGDNQDGMKDVQSEDESASPNLTDLKASAQNSTSEPHENDVLCGRGGSINTHPGNERFRELVEKRKRVYLTARFKREKRLIASSIVQEIHELTPPGRFLAKDSKTGLWVNIGDEKARDKTSQALRENAPSIRAEIETEINKQRAEMRRQEDEQVATSAPPPAQSQSWGFYGYGPQSYDHGPHHQPAPPPPPPHEEGHHNSWYGYGYGYLQPAPPATAPSVTAPPAAVPPAAVPPAAEPLVASKRRYSEGGGPGRDRDRDRDRDHYRGHHHHPRPSHSRDESADHKSYASIDFGISSSFSSWTRQAFNQPNISPVNTMESRDSSGHSSGHRSNETKPLKYVHGSNVPFREMNRRMVHFDKDQPAFSRDRSHGPYHRPRSWAQSAYKGPRRDSYRREGRRRSAEFGGHRSEGDYYGRQNYEPHHISHRRSVSHDDEGYSHLSDHARHGQSFHSSSRHQDRPNSVPPRAHAPSLTKSASSHSQKSNEEDPSFLTTMTNHIFSSFDANGSCFAPEAHGELMQTHSLQSGGSFDPPSVEEGQEVELMEIDDDEMTPIKEDEDYIPSMPEDRMPSHEQEPERRVEIDWSSRVGGCHSFFQENLRDNLLTSSFFSTNSRGGNNSFGSGHISPVTSQDMDAMSLVGTDRDNHSCNGSIGGGSLCHVFDRDGMVSIESGGHNSRFGQRASNTSLSIGQVPSWDRSLRSRSPSPSFDDRSVLSKGSEKSHISHVSSPRRASEQRTSEQYQQEMAVVDDTPLDWNDPTESGRAPPE